MLGGAKRRCGAKSGSIRRGRWSVRRRQGERRVALAMAHLASSALAVAIAINRAASSRYTGPQRTRLTGTEANTYRSGSTRGPRTAAAGAHSRWMTPRQWSWPKRSRRKPRLGQSEGRALAASGGHVNEAEGETCDHRTRLVYRCHMLLTQGAFLGSSINSDLAVGLRKAYFAHYE